MDRLRKYCCPGNMMSVLKSLSGKGLWLGPVSSVLPLDPLGCLDPQHPGKMTVPRLHSQRTLKLVNYPFSAVWLYVCASEIASIDGEQASSSSPLSAVCLNLIENH